MTPAPAELLSRQAHRGPDYRTRSAHHRVGAERAPRGDQATTSWDGPALASLLLVVPTRVRNLNSGNRRRFDIAELVPNDDRADEIESQI